MNTGPFAYWLLFPLDPTYCPGNSNPHNNCSIVFICHLEDGMDLIELQGRWRETRILLIFVSFPSLELGTKYILSIC